MGVTLRASGFCAREKPPASTDLRLPTSLTSKGAARRSELIARCLRATSAGRRQLELSDLVERFQPLGSRIFGIREGEAVQRRGASIGWCERLKRNESRVCN